jgi:hypothetical protein
MSNTVYDAIKAHLEDEAMVAVLADPASGNVPPIRFENEPFVKPEPPAPWLAVQVFGIVSGQESIGASTQAENRWDEKGYLGIKVLVESGSGAQRARSIAEDIRLKIFRGLTLMDGDLEFLIATESEGGPSEEEGNWFEVPVVIEWRHVEA